MLYPSEASRKPLEAILVALNRYMMPLADDTQPSLPSTLLPSPQRQAHSEEQIVVVTFSPRLELHPARGYVGRAFIVLEFIYQGVPILDLPYAYLPLLKCCDGWEDQIPLRHTPITVRPIGTLQSGVAAGDRDAPEIHPRDSLRRSAAALELSIQHIHNAATHPGT